MLLVYGNNMPIWHPERCAIDHIVIFSFNFNYLRGLDGRIHEPAHIRSVLDCQIIVPQLLVVEHFLGRAVINNSSGIKDHGTISQI